MHSTPVAVPDDPSAALESNMGQLGTNPLQALMQKGSRSCRGRRETQFALVHTSVEHVSLKANVVFKECSAQKMWATSNSTFYLQERNQDLENQANHGCNERKIPKLRKECFRHDETPGGDEGCESQPCPGCQRWQRRQSWWSFRRQR